MLRNWEYVCPCPKVPLCVLHSVTVLDFVRWVFAAESYMVTVLGTVYTGGTEIKTAHVCEGSIEEQEHCIYSETVDIWIFFLISRSLLVRKSNVIKYIKMILRVISLNLIIWLLSLDCSIGKLSSLTFGGVLRMGLQSFKIFMLNPEWTLSVIVYLNW